MTALQHLDQLPHLSASAATIRLRQGDLQAAAQHLEKCLRVAQVLDFDLEMAHGLVGMAALSMARGRSALAARLSAVASRVLKAMGVPGCEPALQQHAVAAAQAALGEAVFAAAWAEGLAMPLEEAIALALHADHAE
jgi:hypothetical protein